jgi:hypothetical protein
MPHIKLRSAQGSRLLTVFLFIFIQDPVIGASAVAFLPVRAYIASKGRLRHAPDAATQGAGTLGWSSLAFIDSLLEYVTLFIMMTIGGFYVIKGVLSFGSFVASLVALREMPWSLQQNREWYRVMVQTQAIVDDVLAVTATAVPSTVTRSGAQGQPAL